MIFKSSLVYYAAEPDKGNRRVQLTLVSEDDAETLEAEGLSALRRKRLARLAQEAEEQGCPIGYRDMSMLLFTSVSTLKRDVSHMERAGVSIPLRGRRGRKVEGR